MDAETLAFLAELEEDIKRIPNEELVPHCQRDCPICKRAMVVEADHGISYDVCPDHGIWLDYGELAAVISSIRSGERISRSLAIKKAKSDGQWAGAARGIWSLMFDD